MPRATRTRKRHELEDDDADARPPDVATRLRSSQKVPSLSHLNHPPSPTTTNTAGPVTTANPGRSLSSISASASTPNSTSSPAVSMSMYTFSTEMTSPFNNNPALPPQSHPSSSSSPLFSTSASTVMNASSSSGGTSPLASTSHTAHATMVPSAIAPRTSHGKKRDASYIPRPPNAFILFRSSFIRSQRVPGNVEGNHSTLSKIIGKCWKALPREERERWEKEAVVAQAEHRKKYPDWRFRPGANAAIAAASASSSSRARWQMSEGAPTTGRAKRKAVTSSARGKEKDKGKGKDRGKDAWAEMDDHGDGGEHVGLAEERDRTRDRTREKGKVKTKAKEKGGDEDEERLAKIAKLLGEGMEGKDLEMAVEEWEGGRRRGTSNLPSNNVKEPSSSWSKTTQDGNPLWEQNPGFVTFNSRDYPTPSEDTSDEIEVDLVDQDKTEVHRSRFSRESTAGSPSNSSSSTAPEVTEFPRIPLTHWFKRERSEHGSTISRAPSAAPAIAPTKSPAFSTNATSTGNATRSDEQNSWWVTTGFETDTTGMGYNPLHIGSFGNGFEGFHLDPSENDHEESGPLSPSLNWTKTSGGFVTAIVDPFLADVSDVRETRDSDEAVPTNASGSVPVPVPVPMPISVSVPVPCPSSTGLGPCVCPLPPSLPLSPLSSISAPPSLSPLSPLSGAPATTTATSIAASGDPLDSPSSPLLFPPRATPTQPHPHTHSRPHQHHHTRSSSTFSSLADWDGTVSSSPLPLSHHVPMVSPVIGHRPVPTVASPTAIGMRLIDETKTAMYGIQDSAYDVRYYAPADWGSSYG